MNEVIEQRLIDIVAEKSELDPQGLKPNATLDALGISSISQIEIIFAIEEEFDITLPENPDDRTLGGLATLVARLIAEKDNI